MDLRGGRRPKRELAYTEFHNITFNSHAKIKFRQEKYALTRDTNMRPTNNTKRPGATKTTIVHQKTKDKMQEVGGGKVQKNYNHWPNEEFTVNQC